MRLVVNSGEAQVKQISTVVLDISYHWALITTHLTSQKVQQPAVMSKTYVANYKRPTPLLASKCLISGLERE